MARPLCLGLAAWLFLPGPIVAAPTSDPVVRWSHHAGGSLFGAPALTADGNILVASMAGRLMALKPDGTPYWEYRSDHGFHAAPVVGPDQRIYIGDLGGNHHCLSADGVLQWKVGLDGVGDRRIVASPAVDREGRSFVVSWDNRIRGFDRQGRRIWEAEVAGRPSAPLTIGFWGMLYATSLSPQDPSQLLLQKMAPGWLQVFYRTRHPLWVDRNRVTAAPLVDELGDRVYLAASRESEGILVALSALNGSVLREYRFPRGLLATPAVAPSGLLLVPCLDGRLYALDPGTGNFAWIYQTEGARLVGSPAVDAAGNVIFGDTDGLVRQLDPAGREMWSVTLGGAIWSKPMSLPDGQVLVNSADGRIYALGEGLEFVFPHFGDGEAGSVRLQTRFNFVNLDQDAEVVVDFLDPEGEPLGVSLDGSDASARHRRLLTRGEVWSPETSGGEDLQTGWVRVAGGPGIRGAAVFRYLEDGLVLSESGISASGAWREFVVPGQRSGPLAGTGIALVNLSDEGGNVSVRFHPAKGGEPLAGVVGLTRDGRVARYIWELFPGLSGLAEIQGTLRVSAPHPVGAVAVRQDFRPGLEYPAAVPTLTTFPVIPVGTAAASAGWDLLFPQLARGRSGGLEIQSEMILANPSAVRGVTGRVDFYRPDGSPDPFECEGFGVTASVPFDLPAAGQAVIRTRHPGAVSAGYARIVADSEVGGAMVIQGRIGDVLVYEAGVPPVNAMTDFSILLSGSGWTGLALVNAGAGAARVRLRVYDHRFVLVGEFDLSNLPGGLPPGSHFARFIQEVFPEVDASFQGMITVTSDQPLAAVTLVQHGTPISFPDQPFRLTVYPVLEGRPD